MFTACNKPVDRSYNVWLSQHHAVSQLMHYFGISAKYANILPNLLPTYFMFIINIMKVTVKAMEH